jgi:carbonic anhydrase
MMIVGCAALLGLAAPAAAAVSFDSLLQEVDSKPAAAKHPVKAKLAALAAKRAAAEAEKPAAEGQEPKAEAHEVKAEAHEAKADAHGAKAEAHGAPGGDPWQRLVEGNQRHQAGNWTHPDLNLKRMKELGAEQKPFAAILSCADSRVPPELLFDQGLGDLFVVRVAGNVAGRYDRASLEYGVEHLGIGLLVILGHEKCGAVKATLDVSGNSTAAAGLSPDLKDLVDEIKPSILAKDGAKLDLPHAVDQNVHLSAEHVVEKSPILKEAVEKGHLKVVMARYDLDSGKVEKLE